ncbi:MAG TPA: glycerol-3-phosphate acyltransferase [Candidatus Polarisedimenticolaceae bacterium]
MIDGVLAAIAGYALGSIPTGVWIARSRVAADPRRHGSGATGATNVARVAGTGAGILAFALDAAKGAVAAAVGGPLAAVGAVAGNVASPWLGFRGGKGVATGAGALAVLAPAALAGAAGVFAATAVALRWVSVASLAAAISFPVWALLLRSPRPVVMCGAVCAVAVVIRHRENLERLRSGREPRWGRPWGGPKK